MMIEKKCTYNFCVLCLHMMHHSDYCKNCYTSPFDPLKQESYTNFKFFKCHGIPQCDHKDCKYFHDTLVNNIVIIKKGDLEK